MAHFGFKRSFFKKYSLLLPSLLVVSNHQAKVQKNPWRKFRQQCVRGFWSNMGKK